MDCISDFTQTMNCLMSGTVGILIGIALVLGVYMFDDTPK